jgi:hypothetical protein
VLVPDARHGSAVAIAERGDAAVAAIAEEARANIGLARELIERIKRDFYELGEVLKRLKDSGAAQALGHRSFIELCDKELEISGTAATRLIRIVENMSRELARGLGQYQALAVLELCDATPEDDTPDDVAKGTVRLPSGRTLDVADSTAREKREAAKELREAGDRSSSKGKGTRGMSTSAEDRRVAAEAEAALHAAGLKRATVRAVARPGKVGDLRIEGIPTSGMDRLCKALCGRRGK